MNTETAPRTALIIGASGGIGTAVALRLAVDGFAVGVHYSHNRSNAVELVQRIESVGGQAIAVPGDVANENEMAAVFQTMERTYGGVDAVVNTAGIMTLAPIADFDLETFDTLMRTNVRGTFVVSQLAAGHVRDGGAIVNFSTSVSRTQFPGYGPYVASKAAVEAMTLILARELRGRNVTVNTVAPGPTATPLFFDGKDDETIARLAAASPLERLGDPDDIAETVAHLVGPARWVNGQTIFVNGGLA